MTKFGDFESICKKTPFPFCSVVASSENVDHYFGTGILPTCYSRSVELSNTMIYQVGNTIINIGGLVICLIIIFNIKTKYTAILRQEMLVFFYQFTGLLLSTLIVDCGVAPPGKLVYDYFVAVQIGLVGSCCLSLVFNGLLYFQLWEDGTNKSMWSLRLSAFIMFAIQFIIALLTFRGWSGESLSKSNTTGLFVLMYIINAILVGFYVFSQIFLSAFILDNYWATGSIVLGSIFFTVGQIVAFVLSQTICQQLNHYLDGLFFASLLNLFTIMMVYKYWDIITSEDLEFSVASQETGIAFNGMSQNMNSNRASKMFYNVAGTDEKSINL